jgi:hypothetical protein
VTTRSERTQLPHVVRSIVSMRGHVGVRAVLLAVSSALVAWRVVVTAVQVNIEQDASRPER